METQDVGTPQINPLFASHILNDEGIAKAKALAGEFHGFLCSLEGLLGKAAEGREWSIVKTKLEEAAFFAKKGNGRETRKSKAVIECRRKAAISLGLSAESENG